ncbi:MAG: cell division protein ZapA [Muribaculaceae bacterium]|nr:cell division protein ZapA [Muribaculaceae bacterium]
MKDKLNITIRIADQPPIPLTINREEEEIIRQAESNVNRLWSNWGERFKTTPESLLAMVAFQFAKLHATQNAELSRTVGALNGFEAELDSLLDLEPEGDQAR